MPGIVRDLYGVDSGQVDSLGLITLLEMVVMAVPAVLWFERLGLRSGLLLGGACLVASGWIRLLAA